MVDLEEDVDVDFGVAEELAVHGIHPARWHRARKSVDVRDLLFQLHGLRGSPIVCPFHGDRSPSFYIHVHNNDCHCYGCPDGEQTWDTVKIAARSLDISMSQAVNWLEREYHLPPLTDEEMQNFDTTDVYDPDKADEESGEVLLTANDLLEPYIQEAKRMIIATPMEDRLPFAEELVNACSLAMHYSDPSLMARVVGVEVVRSLVRAKT